MHRRLLPHVAALAAIGLALLDARLFAAAAEAATRFCTSRDAVQLARRQLADLHDVLVQCDPPQQQKPQILSEPPADGLGYPAVSTLLKEHQGRRYLLAANSSRQAVRARVDAGVEAGLVQSMFEDRRLAARAGGWEDDFAPYAVHVYCW